MNAERLFDLLGAAFTWPFDLAYRIAPKGWPRFLLYIAFLPLIAANFILVGFPVMIMMLILIIWMEANED